MAGTTAENAAGIGKGRVEALADGVFAIAMTRVITGHALSTGTNKGPGTPGYF